MKSKIINILIIQLFIIAAICGYFFMRDYRTAQKEIAEYAAMREQFTAVVSNNDSEYEETDKLITESEVVPSVRAGLPLLEIDFEALLQINSSTVGWIAIPNTPVSYPVVQTNNHVRYLTTSFNGEHSRAGTVFADKNNNMRILDRNTIIYGHNMGVGRTDMFSVLLGYKDYEFFNSNRYIQFDTIYRNYGWWEVFAVIEYDVRSNDFQYLQIGFSNENAFMDWIKQVKELSIHDSNISISPNDRVLTLSTCDRSNFGRDGRLLIIAVHINYIAMG